MPAPQHGTVIIFPHSLDRLDRVRYRWICPASHQWCGFPKVGMIGMAVGRGATGEDSACNGAATSDPNEPGGHADGVDDLRAGRARARGLGEGVSPGVSPWSLPGHVRAVVAPRALVSPPGSECLTCLGQISAADRAVERDGRGGSLSWHAVAGMFAEAMTRLTRWLRPRQ